MTVGQLLAAMSSQEITEWQEHLKLNVEEEALRAAQRKAQSKMSGFGGG